MVRGICWKQCFGSTFALDASARAELEDSWIIGHATVGVDVWVDALDEVRDGARDDRRGLDALLVDLNIL